LNPEEEERVDRQKLGFIAKEKTKYSELDG
jgi:hypothetical protein